MFQYLTDEEVATALAEFKRVVRPGGLIVVKDADLAAHPVGVPPIISGQIVEQACAHADPTIAAYFQHLLRFPQLPQFYRTAGVEVVAQQTFPCEWHYPVGATDRPYLETAVPGWGRFALSLPLPAAELPFWRRLADPQAPDYFLNSPDFYFQEEFSVVIGKIPPAI